MKGRTVIINGDRWSVVDVAPAPELAEMVAALLEEEGFVTMTRGAGILSDALTHLGTHAVGTSYVLVPEADREAAERLIEQTVTDYEGDDLEALLAEMAGEGVTLDELLEESGRDSDGSAERSAKRRDGGERESHEADSGSAQGGDGDPSDRA